MTDNMVIGIDSWRVKIAGRCCLWFGRPPFKVPKRGNFEIGRCTTVVSDDKARRGGNRLSWKLRERTAKRVNEEVVVRVDKSDWHASGGRT